jgi:transposase
VIVIDNASIHYTFQDRLETAYKAKGVWIRFLPPYSPDFNPIEKSYNDLKSYIRRYYRRNIARFDSYQAFLKSAIVQTGSGVAAGSRARAHFRNAGIHQVSHD